MIKFEEGEKILLVIRRHWFVMLPQFLVTVVLVVAPLFLFMFLSSGFFTVNLGLGAETYLTKIIFLANQYSFFAYLIWLLLLWVFFFVEWTDYYLDMWIVTDQRVIDVEQKGFFNREVTSFSFRQIQDITVETKGIIETFFKFGTLHIQTAGHNRKIIINDAYHPEEARSLILRLQEQLIKS